MEIRSTHGRHELRGNCRIEFEDEDIAIVFHPSSSYYNRGRQTIESEIEIVFKKFVYCQRNRRLIHKSFCRGERPTPKKIEEARKYARSILETTITAKEYAERFGVGVKLYRLEKPRDFLICSRDGHRTVFLAELNFGSDYLKTVNNNGETYYETTTPEHEAQKRAEEEDRQIQQNRKTCEELLDSLLLNPSREEQLRIVAMFKRLKIS